MSGNRESGVRLSLCASSCCPEAEFYAHGVEVRQHPGRKGVWLSEAQARVLAKEIVHRYGRKATKRHA